MLIAACDLLAKQRIAFPSSSVLYPLNLYKFERLWFVTYSSPQK